MADTSGDPRHNAVIAEWARKKEKIKEKAEKVKEHTKDILTEAKNDESTRANINTEVLNARQSGTPPHTFSGFRDDGEVIQGWEKPWERE